MLGENESKKSSRIDKKYTFMQIQMDVVEPTPSEGLSNMSKVLSSFLGMSRKINQASLKNVSNIVKCIVHGPLKCGSNFLETKWELLI